MVIRGLTLFPKQLEIVNLILESKERFVTLCASRQFSKSTILQNVLLYRSLNNKNITSLYITPTYSLALIVMNKIYQDLLESDVVKSYNKTENQITFINNSVTHFRSSTNPDTIRGLSANYLYIDEASFQSDDVWNSARPTLNVIGKQAVLASTPRSKQGFFYSCCQQGQAGNENYKYLFGHYSSNPFYNKLEVEDAKKTLPESIFRQEYDAEFLDDGGSVFGDIRKCQIVHTFDYFKSDGPYSIGIDLGRQEDYTVVTVLNKFGKVVEIYRDRQKDWIFLISSINAIISKYPGSVVLCETNNQGDVVFDLLRKSNSSIRGFTTTQESKAEIIEELILAFQTYDIQIPVQELFPPLYSEINTFTFTYSPKTRRVSYGSLTGFHDDCIISLALAVKAKKKRGFGFTII